MRARTLHRKKKKNVATFNATGFHRHGTGNALTRLIDTQSLSLSWGPVQQTFCSFCNHPRDQRKRLATMSALQQIILHPYLSQTVSCPPGSGRAFGWRPDPERVPRFFFPRVAALLEHDCRSRQDVPFDSVPRSFPRMVRVPQGCDQGDGCPPDEPQEQPGS